MHDNYDDAITSRCKSAVIVKENTLKVSKTAEFVNYRGCDRVYSVDYIVFMIIT